MDQVTLGSIGAIVLGLSIAAAGLHARRRGRLRNRQGAEVLMGLCVVVGLAAVAAGLYGLMTTVIRF